MAKWQCWNRTQVPPDCQPSARLPLRCVSDLPNTCSGGLHGVGTAKARCRSVSAGQTLAEPWHRVRCAERTPGLQGSEDTQLTQTLETGIPFPSASPLAVITPARSPAAQRSSDSRGAGLPFPFWGLRRQGPARGARTPRGSSFCFISSSSGSSEVNGNKNLFCM